MNTLRNWTRVGVLVAAVVLLVGAGCKKDEKPESGTSNTAGADKGALDTVKDAAKDAADKAGTAVDAGKEAAAGAADKAGDMLDSAAKSVTETATGAEKELSAEAKAEVEAILARADALDGKEDKVIMRCGSCALSMDGSDEHTLKVRDFTMHFCTAKCKERFEKEPMESVLAMEFPEKSEGE